MQKPAPIDKRTALSGHFLFKHLQPAEIDCILKLAVERRFENGVQIFGKGQEGNSMMIVLEGKVRVNAVSKDGSKEITLNDIESGGILGEIALLDGKYRSASAMAVGRCTLLCIQRSEFIPFLKANADMAFQLLMVLCEKLRNTSDMLENIGLLPVPGRLAKLLLRLASPDYGSIPAGRVIELNLSQQDMANLTGASRETVNRTLSQWQADGLINLQFRQLALLDPKALIALSETMP